MALGNPLPLLLSKEDSYEIERSVRFNNDTDDSRFEWTPSGAGTSDKIFTFSCWIKRSRLGVTNQYLYIVNHSSYTDHIMFHSDDTLRLKCRDSNLIYTNRKFRDTSAWMHVLVNTDTTNGTADDRHQIWINGVRETSFSVNNNLNNLAIASNSASDHHIGGNGSNGFGGYMAEVHHIDGQQIDASNFGEEDANTGQWIPKKYAGTYGTNGFYLDFKDNSGTTATTLGKDSSGNGNNFTPQNLSVAAGEGNDSVTDTPTNNFCTWNELDSKSSSLSNGGMVFKQGSGAVYQAHGTMATPDISAHKYYFEAKVAQGYAIGIAPLALSGADNETSRTGTYVVYSNGKKYSGTTSTAYTGSWSSATVIGVAIGEGKIKFFKAGSDEGDAFTGLSGPYKPYAWAAGSTGTGVEINCGQQPFQHTPPTGYVALCTANLPAPTIKDGTKYFNTVLYTGTGSSQTIDVGFAPNFTWIKKRNANENHELQDTVRGATKRLSIDDSSTEATVAGSISAFTSSGFTVVDAGTTNENTHTYVAWNWKEGASNGFDIVAFTPSSGANTYSHGLGVKPDCIFFRSRTEAAAWDVYHSALTADYKLYLSDSVAKIDSAFMNDTEPTDSVFTYDPGSQDGETHIAYCFRSVAGFSKISSYTGNGNADGTFVYTGFRVSYLLVKNTDRAAHWTVYDVKRETINPNDEILEPNNNNSEVTGHDFDFLSNGFKVRNNNSMLNHNGEKIVFMAFAEAPFKYATAR